MVGVYTWEENWCLQSKDRTYYGIYKLAETKVECVEYKLYVNRVIYIDGYVWYKSGNIIGGKKVDKGN